MRIRDFRKVPEFSMEDGTHSIVHKPKREVIGGKYKELVEGMYSRGT